MVTATAQPQAAPETSATSCKHHWIIEPKLAGQIAPQAQGTCLNCGKHKTFSNFADPRAKWQFSLGNSEDQTFIENIVYEGNHTKFIGRPSGY